MTPEELQQRLREWPGTPEPELRRLSPDKQFALLWPLATSSQSRAPAYPAAVLLHRLNPPCSLSCTDAVAALLPDWDISIEEVPWYLVAQFGRAHVTSSAEGLASARDSLVESRMLSVVVYWAMLAEEPANSAQQPTRPEARG